MNTTLFIVSNYNHDCSSLLEHLADCNYKVYDQSTDKRFVKSIWNENFINSRHSGHNISDYYSYFHQNYDSLPEWIGLIKGNIFPRHLTEDFFKRSYLQKSYTFLYQQQGELTYPQCGLFQDNQYYEYANNWYVKNHPHWFFQSIHELYHFIYGKELVDLFVLYSPGACYIIHKDQVLKYPKEFFGNLNSIITYTNPVNPFPSEAHQIERLSNIIYSSIEKPLSHLASRDLFMTSLYANSDSKKYTQHALSMITACEPPPKPWTPVSSSAVNYIAKLLARISSRKQLPKILVSGCHSWKEVYRWHSLPNSDLCVTSILELNGNSQSSANTTSVRFLKLPMAGLLNKLINSQKYDLYVYEGYHLENDATIINSIATQVLNTNSNVLIFDVLGNPFSLLRRICFEKDVPSLEVCNILPLPGHHREKTEYIFHLRPSTDPLLATIKNHFFMCIYGIHWLVVKLVFAVRIFSRTKMLLRP